MMQALVSLFRRAGTARPEPGRAEAIALLASGTWTLDLLKYLEWRRLEELCAAYYEAAGFRTEISHERADGGAEICLYAADASKASILVHCKPWDAYPIGVKTLHELRAAMGAAHGAEGVLFTAGRFTPEAAAFAAKERIELVDGAALLEKLAALAPGRRRASSSSLRKATSSRPPARAASSR